LISSGWGGINEGKDRHENITWKRTGREKENGGWAQTRGRDAAPFHCSMSLDTITLGRRLRSVHPREAAVQKLSARLVPGGSLATSPLQALILEPGESDQALFKSILIYKSTLTIEVHSEYSVPGTKNVWNLLSAVDIGETPTKKETASSINQH
jgi:hypothetical protein